MTPAAPSSQGPSRPPREEMFEIIDDATGAIIGTAPRSRCHGDPSLVHRSVHVVVYHPDGRVLLQKRSANKDIQPGKWDTAVGGHLDVGEDYAMAARREMREELGLNSDLPLRHLFDYKVRNERESENVRVFAVTTAGPFTPQPEELDAVAFFPLAELRARIASGDVAELTPVLVREIGMLPDRPV